MKNIFYTCIAGALFLSLVGCFRNEKQVAEFRVPAMTELRHAAYIQQKLKGMAGIVTIDYHLSSSTFEVTYDSETIREMSIENAIADAGFDVNNRPANPRAKATVEKEILK